MGKCVNMPYTNMPLFSEINPQCSHLIFSSWFFLQKPSLCHCETLLRNLCSQNWHWCGRSPLWILKCIVNCLLLWNSFPHSEHFCFFSMLTPCWYFLCSLRPDGYAALKLQQLQSQKTPSCLFSLWIFSLLFSVNNFSHLTWDIISPSSIITFFTLKKHIVWMNYCVIS